MKRNIAAITAILLTASLTLTTTTQAQMAASHFQATNSAASSYFLGNVGVGRNSPVAKLHVEASTLGSGGGGADSLVYINQLSSWSSRNPWALFVTGYANLGGLRMNAADGVRAIYKMESGGVLGFGVAGDDPITFTQKIRNERLRIAPGGNVGIGTSEPTDKLHVNGTGRFDGGITYAAPLGDLSMGSYTNKP